ncbi:MAG TPA: alanine racemase [Candidatus Dormibacteraeota bacterium]|nr:alanine racemase [Candidatus Dormibacteraeota bacterium]
MTTSQLRWADVHLKAIRANAAHICEHLPKGTHLFAVVKANAYGHGAVKAARAALDGGATRLAVSTLAEARDLTALVPPEHILVMGGLTPAQAPAAAASGCAIGISSLEMAKALDQSEEVVPVHLKIDTGMGRYGCAPEDAPALAKFIEQSAGLRLAGTWTHFASADTDAQMTRKQFELFAETLASLGTDPGVRHACNSAGARSFPEYALDAVRCGIALYGCEWPGTAPAMTLHSMVTHLKTVEAGATIGYGSTWRARERSRIATVAIGYADGVHRQRSNRGHALVRGAKAPLVGTVSMDAITLDVSDIEDVAVGDVVTIIGVDGEEKVTAEQVGRWSGTISYEVLTSLGPRVELRHID